MVENVFVFGIKNFRLYWANVIKHESLLLLMLTERVNVYSRNVLLILKLSDKLIP